MRHISSSRVERTQFDSLELILRDRPSDEKNGVSATLGFTFQQWWAALSIAELLGSDDDFAVGMEVKEDVAILDSGSSPTKVEFCQVKKYEREGAWNLKDLHKRGAKRKDGTYELSIFAKLYSRRQEFWAHPNKLKFISNVGVKLPNENGAKSHSTATVLSALTTEQQNQVKGDLAKQLGMDVADVELSEIYIQQTNLPLGEQEIFVGGKLELLSATGRLPFKLSHTSVAARVLAAEIQSRATNTSYARSFDELKARILTRAQAVDILSKVAESKAPLRSMLDEAIETLDREQHPFIERRDIKEQRVRVCAEASDRTNMIFHGVALALQKVKGPIEASIGAHATLGELMNEVVEEARALCPDEFAGLPLAYIRAVALLVISNGIDIDVLTTTAGPEPKEEE